MWVLDYWEGQGKTFAIVEASTDSKNNKWGCIKRRRTNKGSNEMYNIEAVGVLETHPEGWKNKKRVDRKKEKKL